MTTKILQSGVMVIAGDTHLSAWVEQHGKLRIAEKYLAAFRQYVPVGGVVVDAGACIGDHTATYADWVGPTGKVLAFEPNPEAFQCLMHNTKSMKQVEQFDIGLSVAPDRVSIHLDPNAGASHLSDDAGEVLVDALDDFNLNRLDFMKLDIEGFETRAIRGARETLIKLNPVLLVEVNQGALIRAGSSRDELIGLLSGLGYSCVITEPKLDWDDAQYDILCLPP